MRAPLSPPSLLVSFSVGKMFVLTTLALIALEASSMPQTYAQQTETSPADSARVNPSANSKAEKKKAKLSAFDQVIVDAFQQTHDGWSSDEVILRDDLNLAFLQEFRRLVRERSLDNDTHRDAEINWRLIGLRKAGKLSAVKTTRRANTDVSDVTHIAEMAVRSIQDQEKISSDRIMTDPKHRKSFDALVKEMHPKADCYAVRKAAFQLRKTRRLKPELISRIADWGRIVSSYSVKELRGSADVLPEHPGIYIFRDKTGYLYIGQTENLRKRLTKHLDESHNLSLASYLAADHQPTVEVHAFDPNSRAKEVRVRRAYESELIASRKPRFNVQP